MILKNPDKHLSDQDFFTHIKLLNLLFENDVVDVENDRDDGCFKLSDLQICYEEGGTTFNKIFMECEILEITVAINTEHGFTEEIEKVKEEVKGKTQKEKKILMKLITDVSEGKEISVKDVGKLSWVWYGIYGRVRFDVARYKIPKEIETIFRTEMDKYLEKYINDKLAISTKNYLKFETQKRALINLIEKDKKIDLYGNNFIIKEKIGSGCILEKLPEFSIIQTVYAMQKLGYLKVVGVWSAREYSKGSHVDTEQYLNVNVILEEAFIQEINAQYKKSNPQNFLEKYDAKNRVLKFAGQEIELSKKGKETDAVLLIKTLLKADAEVWKHNDEILEDWGYNEDDQKKVPKNKVYFAGQKINTAVALKTKIEDLIECNTSKARINPKYRKVDE